MFVALDTNILVYRSLFGSTAQDQSKSRRAGSLIEVLSKRHTIVIPGQVLGELYNVLSKRGVARGEVREIVRGFALASRVAPAGAASYATALNLAADHQLQFWDALIITTSSEAGCGLLLSEDMQDGLTLGGVTVVSPFTTSPHPRLSALLNG